MGVVLRSHLPSQPMDEFFLGGGEMGGGGASFVL